MIFLASVINCTPQQSGKLEQSNNDKTNKRGENHGSNMRNNHKIASMLNRKSQVRYFSKNFVLCKLFHI